jgi:cyclic pyranopterin monophosphate synthase
LGPVPKRATVKPTHIDANGRITMVDVSRKRATSRFASARALVRMNAEARAALQTSMLAKGDAFVAAQIAAIMAAKQTAALIPLAHSIPLGSVDVRFHWLDDGTLSIEADARTAAQTGVELEAMLAASIAALTIYDMAKAIDKGITIESVRLLKKSGGKSGTFLRPSTAQDDNAEDDEA